jgi:hypothetical protein
VSGITDACDVLGICRGVFVVNVIVVEGSFVAVLGWCGDEVGGVAAVIVDAVVIVVMFAVAVIGDIVLAVIVVGVVVVASPVVEGVVVFVGFFVVVGVAGNAGTTCGLRVRLLNLLLTSMCNCCICCACLLLARGGVGVSGYSLMYMVTSEELWLLANWSW